MLHLHYLLLLDYDSAAITKKQSMVICHDLLSHTLQQYSQYHALFAGGDHQSLIIKTQTKEPFVHLDERVVPTFLDDRTQTVLLSTVVVAFVVASPPPFSVLKNNQHSAFFCEAHITETGKTVRAREEEACGLMGLRVKPRQIIQPPFTQAQTYIAV